MDAVEAKSGFVDGVEAEDVCFHQGHQLMPGGPEVAVSGDGVGNCKRERLVAGVLLDGVVAVPKVVFTELVRDANCDLSDGDESADGADKEVAGVGCGQQLEQLLDGAVCAL